MSETEFQFACPICQSPCRATESMRGRQMQCPECLSSILVPEPAASDRNALELDYFVKSGAVARDSETAGERREPGPAGAAGEADRAVAEQQQPAGESQQAAAEPERTIFREPAHIAGQPVSLAVTERRIQAGSVLDVPVEAVCNVRLLATAERDLVCGELLYVDQDRRVHHVALEIRRFLRSKLRRTALQLVAALRQVLPEAARLELLDQAEPSEEQFWSQQQ